MTDTLTNRPPRWEQAGLLLAAIAVASFGWWVFGWALRTLDGTWGRQFPPEVMPWLRTVVWGYRILAGFVGLRCLAMALAREERVDLSPNGVAVRSWAGRRYLAWDEVAGLSLGRGPVYVLTADNGRLLRVPAKRFGDQAEAAVQRLEDCLAPARERWRTGLQGEGRSLAGTPGRAYRAIVSLPVVFVCLFVQTVMAMSQRGKPVTAAQVHQVAAWCIAACVVMAAGLLFATFRASRHRLRLTGHTLSETVGTRVRSIPLAAVTRIELRRRAGECRKSESVRVFMGDESIGLGDGFPDYALVLEHIARAAPGAAVVETSKVAPEPEWAAWLQRVFGDRWACPAGSPAKLRAMDRALIVSVVLLVAGVLPTCLPVVLIWDWVDESHSANVLASGDRTATAVVRFFSPRDDPRQAVCDHTYGGQKRVGFLDLPPEQLSRLQVGQEVRVICTGGEGRSSCYAPEYQKRPDPPLFRRLLLAVATMLVGITLMGTGALVAKRAGVTSFG